MATKRQTGQTPRPRRFIAPTAAGAIGLALTVLTGCSTTPTTAQETRDPMLGPLVPPGTPPPVPHAAATTPAQNTAFQAQPTTQPGLPPIPTQVAATNNATIAGAGWNTPSGSLALTDNPPTTRQPLVGQTVNDRRTQQTPVMLPGAPANPRPRIEEVPDAVPVGQASAPTAPSQAPPAPQTANAAPVAPGNPPALPTGLRVTAPLETPASYSVTPPAPATSADALKQQLQARGVFNQKEDPAPEGGIHLTCYVTRGANLAPRIIEVTAADYTTAAQAILQQLSQ